MVIGNPVILEQSHAHNAPDFWDGGSVLIVERTGLLYILKLVCY